jgi:hypothetical protein
VTETIEVGRTFEKPECVHAKHRWMRANNAGSEMCPSCGTERWIDYGAPEWVYLPFSRRGWIQDRLSVMDSSDLVNVESVGPLGIGMDPITRWWASFDGIKILSWRTDDSGARSWLDRVFDGLKGESASW